MVFHVQQHRTKRISQMNKNYASQVEAKAAALLEPLGFVLCNDQRLQHTFADSNGATFYAMADFYHPELGLYVEVKNSETNTMKTKAQAERGMTNSYNTRPEITHSWSNSTVKHAIVQEELTPDNYIVLFMGKVTDKVKKRIINNGLHAVSEKGFKVWFMRAQIRQSIASK
jgi:hypothetical protein